MKFFGPSWKTSLGALVFVVGCAVEVFIDPGAGKAIQATGAGILGLSARDNNVSTEEVKAKAPVTVGKW